MYEFYNYNNFIIMNKIYNIIVKRWSWVGYELK